jgi:hypothetical protein
MLPASRSLFLVLTLSLEAKLIAGEIQIPNHPSEFQKAGKASP